MKVMQYGSISILLEQGASTIEILPPPVEDLI